MPTITNRSQKAKGFSRGRENLSRQMRTTHLGEMTRNAFQLSMEEISTTKNCKRICYYNNTAVLSRDNADKTMFRYSFTPLILKPINKPTLSIFPIVI